MKIFYSAYTCKGNVGDFLINKYQIEEYSKYGDVYVDLTGMPEDFAKGILGCTNPGVHDFVAEYGLSYRGKNMFKVLSVLHGEGFTHFTKSPGPYAVISLPIKKLCMRLLGALGYITARKKGMKVMAMGIDLNLSQLPQWLYRLNIAYFNHYNIIGVRSIRNKERIGLYIKSANYCPDMAFLCPGLKKPDNIVRKKIAISFRQVSDVDTLVTLLNKICAYYYSIEYEVHIVYQVVEDVSFCKLLAEKLSNYNPYFRKSLISFDELSCYEHFDVVFSNRLHVLLMGAMHGAIPFAMLSKNIKERKIVDIWDSVFEGNYWMYIDDSCLVLDEFLHNELCVMRNKVFKFALIQKQLCEDTIRSMFLDN